MNASKRADFEKQSIRDLQWEVRQWALQTFKGQTVDGICAHLVREAGELRKSPGEIGEMADVFILLLDVAAFQGVTVDELIVAAWTKFQICKRRKWKAADAEGVFEHEEEA